MTQLVAAEGVYWICNDHSIGTFCSEVCVSTLWTGTLE